MSGPVIWWCALLTIWLGVVGSANATIEIVGETHATFAWSASEGPVVGYYVYVARNGTPTEIHSIVTDGNSQTIHGDFGDTIRVSTTAFDEQGNTGPQSELSDEIRFVEAPAPTPLATTPPEPPTPVGHWSFDEGGGPVAGDDSSLGNDGSLVGAPGWIAGMFGTALEFGSSDWVLIPDHPTLEPDTAITIAAWLRPDQGGTRDVIKKDGGYAISTSWFTRSVYVRFNQSNTYRLNSTTPFPTDGSWIHVAATFDGQEIRLYINGALDGTPLSAPGLVIGGSDQPLSIGARYDGARSFVGAVDEVHLFNHALSAFDVQNLFLGSTPTPTPATPTPATPIPATPTPATPTPATPTPATPTPATPTPADPTTPPQPTTPPEPTIPPEPTAPPQPTTPPEPTIPPEPTTPPEDPPSHEEPASAYDFNGDGYSDILLRNTTTGEQECWQMYGTEIASASALPTVDPGWLIAGTGDFNSDGTTDILWRNVRNGAVHLWFMGDSAIDGELDLELEAGWVIDGSGDFDGDGRSEIAIGNQSSRLEIWGLKGDFVRLAELSVRRGWKLAGIGDVDGDGDDDIILQDGRKRRIEVLLMSIDFSVKRMFLDKQQTARWKIIDSADYDGDGQSDLLWRDFSQGVRGDAAVWHLSNSLQLSGNPLNLNLGNDLSVVGSADYDADGSADLLVLDPATRELALWLMEKAGVHSVQSLGTLAKDWLPAGFDANDDAALP